MRDRFLGALVPRQVAVYLQGQVSGGITLSDTTRGPLPSRAT